MPGEPNCLKSLQHKSLSRSEFCLNNFMTLREQLNLMCFAVDCVWATWGQWNTCSTTCGPGAQQRTRAKSRKEKNGGACQGNPTASRACNMRACPVDCVWATW